MDNILNRDIDDETVSMINPSDVIEYLFCPRFIYFIYCLDIPQHEEKHYKVLKGREIHHVREHENVHYLRKKLGCIKKDISVYLASKKLRVRGVVDEVLFLSDNTAAPLDYKLTHYHDYTFKTHFIQSALYALLISESYNIEVKKGFICYVESNYQIKEIVFENKHFDTAYKSVAKIFDIIEKGVFPNKTSYKMRCIDCCYKNICV